MNAIHGRSALVLIQAAYEREFDRAHTAHKRGVADADPGAMSVGELVTRDWHRAQMARILRTDEAQVYTSADAAFARKSLATCLMAFGFGAEAEAKRAADATAQTVPQALQSIVGPVTPQPAQATAFTDTLPIESVEPWAEVARFDEMSFQGALGEYRDSTSVLPRSNYVVGSTYQPVLTFGTQVELTWGQQNAARSPAYRVDPMQADLMAANMIAGQSLESLAVNGNGTSLPSLANCVAGLREVSTLTAGTSSIENVVADILGEATKVIEASKGAFTVDSLLISDRILYRIGKYTTTSAGYPFNALTELLSGLAAKGIRRVVPASSLQGAGGSALLDRMVFFSSGMGGLKRYVAMPFAPVRTVEVGLSQVTYLLTRQAGLYAPLAGGVCVYDMAVSAS